MTLVRVENVKSLSHGVYAECDVHCTQCTTNGAGKCDSGYCMTGYAYVSATMTCGG